MNKRILISCLLFAFLFTGCNNRPHQDSSEPPLSEEISEEDTSKIEGATLKERLSKLPRIVSFRGKQPTQYFANIYLIEYEQYIDHDHKELGTFYQSLEFGFNGFDLPNTFVTLGYMNSGLHNNYTQGENELAYLLNGNYICMEHRYFNESKPFKLDYSNNDTWKYLTTYQAACDARDVVRSFKRILDGKWLSTGGSKSGMTTHMFNYYFPGEVDLYVSYVAPFCNSFYDERMMKFVYEEAGNDKFGDKAEEKRKEVLDFQIKMLEYRDVLADKFYSSANTAKFSEYATKDLIYDAAVIDFAVGFWQYYQSFTSLEKCLAMKESTDSEIKSKQDACYRYFNSIMSASDFYINGDFTPYEVQAYQELGNYCYDFHYIREALTEKAHLVVKEEEEKDLAWKLLLSEEQLKLEHHELMYTKINDMLENTESTFILIYGSTDPWYAVRPDDVKRDNIHIFVNHQLPHTTTISSFSKSEQAQIMEIINEHML